MHQKRLGTTGLILNY